MDGWIIGLKPKERKQSDEVPRHHLSLPARCPTGTYYFFAIVPDSGGSIVWDVPANLAAGDNPVAFNQSNSERLQ